MQTATHPLANYVVSSLSKLSDLSSLLPILTPRTRTPIGNSRLQGVKFVKIVKFVQFGSKSRHDHIRPLRLCKRPELTADDMMCAAAWFVGFAGTNQDNRVIISSRLPIYQALGTARLFPTDYTDCM
jgi:hypothetical protein